ncbi:MAG TPA: hypothetical protein VED84_00680 [Acidimicrobiales bacterium]|nr:hypothetical protein [Acidimicrobiales bacterium]
MPDQLAARKILFPPEGSVALASRKIGPDLDQFAGQQLPNGAPTEAWAGHFWPSI